MKCCSPNHENLSESTQSSNSPQCNKSKLQKASNIIITTTGADEGSPFKMMDSQNVIGNKDGTNVISISQRGPWRPFRRDKVTPLANRAPSPIGTTPYIFTKSPVIPDSDSATITSLESPQPGIIGKPSKEEVCNNYPKSSRDHSPSPNAFINNKESPNAIKQLSPLKSNWIPKTTDASGDPFLTIANNSTPVQPLWDTMLLPQDGLELGSNDIGRLLVPGDGSWDRDEDSTGTNSISHLKSPIPYGTQLYHGSSGSEFTILSKRSGSKRTQLSTSFDFRNSPITATRSNLKLGDGSQRGTDDIESEKSSKCKLTNLSTSQGRRFHAAMIMALAVAPIIALLIQNCIELFNQNNVYRVQKEIKSDILYSVEIGTVMHRTQIERGLTVLFISTKGQEESVVKSLVKAYRDTDKAISSLTKWFPQNDPQHFRKKELYYARIKDFRESLKVNDMPNKTKNEAIKFYSDDNELIQRFIGQSVQLSTNGGIWRTLISYYMLILATEQAGVERALGSTFFAEGSFSNEEMVQYLQRFVKGRTYLTQSLEFTSRLKTIIYSDYSYDVEMHIKRMRKQIQLNEAMSPNNDLARMWFSNMTHLIDALKRVQDFLAEDMVTELDSHLDELRNNLIEAVVIISVSLLLFPFVIVCVYRLTKRIQAYAEKLQDRTLELEIERRRSEMLLYELLPEQVAQKLLNNEDVAPMSYKAVTIFFSDIVGFTYICSRSTPLQVIDMLNSLYRIFDDIISRHRVYKVETIGDAYMVASGVPEENPTGHATEIAQVALDMRDNICHLMVNHLPEEKLQLRIGINSGPVVAGVVGHKMPRYCLFGDTVNVASRMESTSLPLQIQISESTKRELEKIGGFSIQPRGKVEVKGKGLMLTYWLHSRKEAKA